VLFDGRSELDQISRIFSLLGSPNEKIWPGLSKLPAASKVGISAAYRHEVSVTGRNLTVGHVHWGCVLKHWLGAGGKALGQLLRNTPCLLTCTHPTSMLKPPSSHEACSQIPDFSGCRTSSPRQPYNLLRTRFRC
jgi:hypothetical protein